MSVSSPRLSSVCPRAGAPLRLRYPRFTYRLCISCKPVGVCPVWLAIFKVLAPRVWGLTSDLPLLSSCPRFLAPSSVGRSVDGCTLHGTAYTVKGLAPYFPRFRWSSGIYFFGRRGLDARRSIYARTKGRDGNKGRGLPTHQSGATSTALPLTRRYYPRATTRHGLPLAAAPRYTYATATGHALALARAR